MINILIISKLFPTAFKNNLGVFNKIFLDYLCKDKEDHINMKVIRALPFGENVIVKNKRIIFHPARIIKENYEVHFPRILSFGKYFRNYHHFHYLHVLKKFIKKIDITVDIIHAHWLYPDGYVAVKIGEVLAKPVVVHCHGGDINMLLREKKLQKYNDYVLNNCQKIIVVSRDLKMKILNQYPALADKINIVYNGIDFSEYKGIAYDSSIKILGLKENKVKKILYVGNILVEKGIFDLIAASKILLNIRNDFKLFMVGYGDKRTVRQLKDESLKQGLTKHIELIGECDHNLVKHWFNIADLTILPSHSEGFGVVLVESLATGTPVVATKVGGIPEIVDNIKKGKLVPVKDPKAIAMAIEELLSNKVKSNIPYDQMEKFDIKLQAQEILKIYKETINYYKNTNAKN